MFRYLVTPSGAKIAYTVTDLAGQTRRTETGSRRLLGELSSQDARILRPVGVLGYGGSSPASRSTTTSWPVRSSRWRAEHHRERERERAQLEAEEAERERKRRFAARAGSCSSGIAIGLLSLLFLGGRPPRMNNQFERSSRLASARGRNSTAIPS